jgi:Flp pilus assembly protein TadG
MKTKNKTQAKAKNKQRGAALVETALVFTAALSMIVFIINMGQILLYAAVYSRACASGRT